MQISTNPDQWRDWKNGLLRLLGGKIEQKQSVRGWPCTNHYLIKDKLRAESSEKSMRCEFKPEDRG